ncbi:maltokinase N-terminal cap-like domain-containing protein [[Mycobacterium] burgundiense]|uniref:Maltokinase n=1 Tax=[Mycobacterium] burgundiense TaxID=3064286 RepID=A0ABN9NQF7_9MYCO|nr:maltokinase [Mycolicibacterium sp. MU0053]CAJ1510372.1 maltokinase [Mycolicibacterium sp. MU0053]
MTLPFAEWLPRQRWYAGRNRRQTAVSAAAITALRADLELVLLDVSYADGSTERYQVVVLWSAEKRTDYPDIATIGAVRGRTAYDALYDAASVRHLLELCGAGATRGDVAFSVEPGVGLPVDAPSRVSGAEQSNTSVVFGDQAILKVFRRVNVGINPDIELNRVLGNIGNRHVARLLASFETTWDGQPCPLGMVTVFAAGSAEGWALGTAAAGRHYAGGAGDFTEASHQLGQAVASVHAALAAELGTASGTFPVDSALARLDSACAEVPELSPYQPRIADIFKSVAGQEIVVQRIHGDLHLGQVLRTPTGWLVIDFEGEPGAPLEERRRPDSPLRDVAGMLRSYEYAAFQPLVGRGGQDISAALEWSGHNRGAFCDGYADLAGFDPRQAAKVLAAYELDKAVYETAYEARYRADWLPIPLRSIGTLTGATGPD